MNNKKINKRVHKDLRETILKRGSQLSQGMVYLSDGLFISDTGEIVEEQSTAKGKRSKTLRSLYDSLKEKNGISITI
jgi:virulence-associated protein VapD